MRSTKTTFVERGYLILHLSKGILSRSKEPHAIRHLQNIFFACWILIFSSFANKISFLEWSGLTPEQLENMFMTNKIMIALFVIGHLQAFAWASWLDAVILRGLLLLNLLPVVSSDARTINLINVNKHALKAFISDFFQLKVLINSYSEVVFN